jgi:dihydrolipoamide dehydrogenase
MYKFKFADIGEGLHEGKVAEIYLNEGKEVKEGDSLFSVETDKVTSDIPSPTNGKIIKVLMKVGDTIHVGQEIYHIDDGSKDEDLIPEEKAASVVGSIEVSNEVVNFDNMSKKLPSKNIEPIYNKIGNQV